MTEWFSGVDRSISSVEKERERNDDLRVRVVELSRDQNVKVQLGKGGQTLLLLRLAAHPPFALSRVHIYVCVYIYASYNSFFLFLSRSLWDDTLWPLSSWEAVFPLWPCSSSKIVSSLKRSEKFDGLVSSSSFFFSSIFLLAQKRRAQKEERG